jgi:hypothetical protein
VHAENGGGGGVIIFEIEINNKKNLFEKSAFFHLI